MQIKQDETSACPATERDPGYFLNALTKSTRAGRAAVMSRNPGRGCAEAMRMDTRTGDYRDNLDDRDEVLLAAAVAHWASWVAEPRVWVTPSQQLSAVGQEN